MKTPYADTLTAAELDATLNDWGGALLRTANPVVKQLVAHTFPEYRGRKVALRYWRGPRQLDNYWSGGSRSDWRLIDPQRGVAATSDDMHNPFTKAAHEKWDLPIGMIAVEHDIFCGKDMGLRVYVRREDVGILTGASTAMGLPAFKFTLLLTAGS